MPRPSSPRPVLEVENLGFTVSDGSRVLDKINLVVYTRDFLLLCGKNGSGKSLLAQHIKGLLQAQEGTVQVCGRDIKTDRAARLKVGLVFQNADAQIVGETVAEDLAFGPRNLSWSKQDIRAAVSDTAALMGLSGLLSRDTHTLSGGEKRRLAVAGVLIMQPEVLILDEPFANLDFDGTVQVLERVVALHGQGYTVIVVTHDLGVVLAHANRLVCLAGGRIVLDAPPWQVLDELPRYRVRRPSGNFHCARDLQTLSWLS